MAEETKKANRMSDRELLQQLDMKLTFLLEASPKANAAYIRACQTIAADKEAALLKRRADKASKPKPTPIKMRARRKINLITD